MKRLLEHIRRLSPAKRRAIWLMVACVILTWLAACLILATSWIR